MMKKSFTAVNWLLLILNSTVLTAGEVKPYKLSQACVEYTVTGNAFNGSETLYFDNHGAREAKYTHYETTLAGMKQSNKSVTYREGSTIYMVDLKTNTGTKMENHIMKSLEGQNAQQAIENMLTQMGGKKIGTDEVLGRTCEIWELSSMHSKIWVWNGIGLKTETDTGDMRVLATKITDSFDKSKLQRPLNIEYKDVGSTGDMMKNLKSKQSP